MTFGSRVTQLALRLAAGAAVSMIATASFAYTAEQQQLCSGDAFRLCSSDIPDVDRVTACMVRQRAQLSPGCLSVFRYEPPAGQPRVIRVRAGKPVSIKPRKPKKLRDN